MKKILALIILCLVLVGCGAKEEPKEPQKNNDMNNTVWIATDNSEMIFDETSFNWYRDEGVYSDNYYGGTFEYYRGTDAVKFITTELSQYGVTESELQKLFERNEKYSEENFVVFNLVYNKVVMSGENITPERPLVPWYGFILEDGTVLDVVNMNTGTYYTFTKK